MTIIEFARLLNEGTGINRLRFTICTTGGASSCTLKALTGPRSNLEVGSVLFTVGISSDERVTTVVLKQTAPVRVLRHINRVAPEIPVK